MDAMQIRRGETTVIVDRRVEGNKYVFLLGDIVVDNPGVNSSKNSSTCVNEENQRRPAENFSSFYSTAVRSLKEKSHKLMDFVWRLQKSIFLRTRRFELGFILNSFVQCELKN